MENYIAEGSQRKPVGGKPVIPKEAGWKKNKLSLKFKAQMAKDDFHTEDAKMDKTSEHLRGDHP